MTKRLSGNDYMRPGEHRNNLTAPIFYINGCAAVRGGPFYVNGRRYNPDNGYPYPGGGTSRKLEDGTDAKWCVPTVFSAHPTADTKADAFGFNGHATNRSGFHRVCECLIFTNEVTETERLAITGYLMKKWMNHEVEFEVVDGNPFVSVDTQTIGGLAAGAGENHYVENISGKGTFSKRGEGTVFMNDHVCPDGSLDIAEGTLTLNSRLPPDVADIPEGAHEHFDASDVSTLTVKSSGQVSEWRDIRRFEVAGDVDMSKGGVIRVTGALSTLVPGDYTLLTAASLTSGKWNVILDGELRRNLGCEIRTDGNSLTLSVKAPGMTLIVR